MSKAQLTLRGWTASNLRDRLAGCRANRSAFRAITTAARWQFRAMNAALYLRYRRDLSTLQS